VSVKTTYAPFDFPDLLQPSVPACFEFGCDQAIIRIHGLVAAARELRLITCLLQFQLKHPSLFLLLAA
jgi:hypothetical protein